MKIQATHRERCLEGETLSHINVTPATNAGLAIRNTEEQNSSPPQFSTT